MQFFVYVLVNAEGKTYVGQTSDLERRLVQHNDPNCRLTLYTKRHSGPWRLLHSESFPSRAAAMRREKELNSGKGREWIRRVLLHGC
ncbi:MAG: GIY-YIG nuclease family protein [Candidatus Acidiferrales bacterium]